PEIRDGATPNGARELAIDAALGLSAEEIANTYSKSLVTTRTIDPAMVSSEKRRVIARERVLTWHDPDPRGLDAIGGLDLLKQWLRARRAAFTQEARDFGLDAPRGALLLGIPGCGKSLTAKAVASAWQMPLLRLDMGALRSKYVGESEGNIRKALKVAETVSPCILWADEIEKAPAGRPATAASRRTRSARCSRGCRSARATCSSSPPRTRSAACRRSCCARAGSTRSSGSTCRRASSARRSSPRRCASAGAAPT